MPATQSNCDLAVRLSCLKNGACQPGFPSGVDMSLGVGALHFQNNNWGSRQADWVFPFSLSVLAATLGSLAQRSGHLHILLSPHSPGSSPRSRLLSLPNTCLQTRTFWPCLQLQESPSRPVLPGRKGHEVLLSFLHETAESPWFLLPSSVTSLHTAGINKGSSTHKLQLTLQNWLSNVTSSLKPSPAPKGIHPSVILCQGFASIQKDVIK